MYISEGLFVTCSIDYMSLDWNRKSYFFFGFMTIYFIPMCSITYLYTLIIKAVIHREQKFKYAAGKMDVKEVNTLPYLRYKRLIHTLDFDFCRRMTLPN